MKQLILTTFFGLLTTFSFSQIPDSCQVAGNDTSFTVCTNQSFFLYCGGSLPGGQWWDPANNAVSDSVSGLPIPGQYWFMYTNSIPGCPEDTAYCLVSVDDCWWNVDEIELQGFSVFPNPTNNIVNILYKGSHKNVKYRLLNLYGKTLIEKEILEFSTRVSLEALSKGYYFLEIFNEEGHNTYRIIKE